MAKFKRILLKLSGESLMGKQSFGIDPERLSDYAKQIKEVHEMGVQIGIVIGGGNIFRGLSGSAEWPCVFQLISRLSVQPHGNENALLKEPMNIGLLYALPPRVRNCFLIPASNVGCHHPIVGDAVSPT